MKDNIYISLKVCGRPHENSGFNPLVYYNSPLFDVPDTVYSGFNEVPYFFSVIIEKTQVVYTIIMNNIRSYQGFRLGNLKIAMSIPKGYRISNGKTPYDALISIKDYIIDTCMTCKDPVRLVYEFNSGIISPTLLDDIAQKFPLEFVTGPYHPMSVGASKGYIILPEEQINLLLSDVQYPEFSKYGEIVVAQSVQATNYTAIVNLQIPRKSRFAIIVDGVEDSYVENLEEKISVCGKKNPKFYDNQQISFTISDIRKGQIVPNVLVDEEREIVSINTTSLSTAKSTKVHIVFPKEVEGYFYTFKKDFQLVYTSGNESKTIILNDYVFTLMGEEIGWLDNPLNFRVIFNKVDEYHIKLDRLSKNNIGEYQLIISVEKIVKAKPIVCEPRNTDSDVIKVDVSYKEPPYNRTVTLCLNTKDGYDVLLSTTKILQSKSVFYIPKTWKISIDELFVRYETSEYLYTSPVIHDKKSNTYLASNFEAKHKTFVDKKIKPNKTLIASFISLLLGLILGCVLIYYAKPIIDRLLEPEPEFTCEYCSAHFKSSDLLTNHIRSAHLKYLCEDCGQRFLSKDDLTSHINSRHLPEVCDVCEQRFSTPAELIEHRNSVHFTHVCDVCHERFDTEEKLNKHKNTNHRASVVTKPFKCVSCNASFDTKAALESHIKSKHDSKFQCRLCGYWFNSMKELDGHMGFHHKRYECEFCGQDTYFESKQKLDAHIRDKHRSEER